MRNVHLALLAGALILTACSEGEVPPGGDGPVTAQDSEITVDKGVRKDGVADKQLADKAADLPAADLPAADQQQPDQQLPDLLAPDTGPLPNDTCFNAKIIKLVNGKVTVQGDTSALKDEFSKLTCGASVLMDGPQAYYMVFLNASESYKVTLKPQYDGYFYIFSPLSFCTESSIQKDCSSQGSTGDASPLVGKGKSKTLTFAVPKSGYWYITVDGSGATNAGAFTLEVELDCSKFANKCNTGINDKGTCKAKPKTGSCNDENPCTLNDSCQTSGGLGICKGTAKNCPSNTCNTGKCDKTNGQCLLVPKLGSCNDSDPCTFGDTCQVGVCKGTKMDCTSLADTCNLGLCVSGKCTKVPKSGTISCNDKDLCTVNDKCSNGVCGGTQKQCAGDQCNSGGCAVIGGKATCVKVYKAGFCSDANLCTVSDTCANVSGVGVCKGKTKNCAGDQCNTGQCNKSNGSCVKVYKAGSCTDKDLCTTSDKCVNVAGQGQCKGTTKSCAGDQCNTGLCNKLSGSCYKKAKTGSCNDGNSCTTGEACKSIGNIGYCTGGKYPSDSWEPNNSCALAKHLGTVNEGNTWIQKSGSISPPGDVDWYAAKGLEVSSWCFPGSSQSFYFRAKLYVPSGRTMSICLRKGGCGGSVSCKTGGGTLEVSYKVSGKCAWTDNTDARIWIIAADGKKSCEKYTVSFNYK